MNSDQLAELREEQIDLFLNGILGEMKRAILKAGGDYEAFRDYLGYKEVIGELDTAIVLAFQGVKDIEYKGCF